MDRRRKKCSLQGIRIVLLAQHAGPRDYITASWVIPANMLQACKLACTNNIESETDPANMLQPLPLCCWYKESPCKCCSSPWNRAWTHAAPPAKCCNRSCKPLAWYTSLARYTSGQTETGLRTGEVRTEGDPPSLPPSLQWGVGGWGEAGCGTGGLVITDKS